LFEKSNQQLTRRQAGSGRLADILHESGPAMQQAGPSVIRSISQRGLLTHWRRASAGRCIPDFGSFKLTDSDHDRHQLLFWHVVGSGYDRVFRSLFQGNYVVEGLGGNTLLEVTRASFGPFQQYAFATLSDCADRRVPIYSVISSEVSGQPMDCERLLLPFGRDPGVVDVVLASLQLVGNRGSLDRRAVLAHFVARCEFTYTAAISEDTTEAALPA
jgi:hypothetical protein